MLTPRYYFKSQHGYYMRGHDERLKTTSGTNERSQAKWWPTPVEAHRATKESRKDAAENGGTNWRLVSVKRRLLPRSKATNAGIGPKIVMDAGAVGAFVGAVIGGLAKILLHGTPLTPSTKHCEQTSAGCFAGDRASAESGNPFAWPSKECCRCTCHKCTATRATK